MYYRQESRDERVSFQVRVEHQFEIKRAVLLRGHGEAHALGENSDAMTLSQAMAAMRIRLVALKWLRC